MTEAEAIPEHLSEVEKQMVREAQEKITNRPKLEVVNVPIGNLEPCAWNPRTLSTKDRNDLKRSLETFGCVEPLVIRKADMSIVGGHQRFNTASELGWPDVPCVILDMTEIEAKLLNISLNKISGDWDTDRLQSLLGEIATEDVDLGLTGFDDATMANLGIFLDPDLAPEPDQETPEKKPSLLCPKCGFEFTVGKT